MRIKDWKSWTFPDYQEHFLGEKAARGRMRGKGYPYWALGPNQLAQFCAPIRRAIQQRYASEAAPKVSVVIVAHNEEKEMMATFVSYASIAVPDGLAELIVVDNDSSDRTADIIKACGATYIKCTQAGTPFARRKGFEAIHPNAAYVWMSDADVRVIRPKPANGVLGESGGPLMTSFEYMEQHANVAGVSTGIVFEKTHWLHALLRNAAIRVGWSRRYSCWAGGNQFVRTQALREIGGIDTDVLFGEDHHRHYKLARWAKEQGLSLESANSNASLADPVYHSGRRHGTLWRVLRHIWDTVRRGRYFSRGGNGWASGHRKGVGWRNVR